MAIHMNKEVDRLKRPLMDLCGKAVESFQEAVKSVSTRDSNLARKVIAEDVIIDRMEVAVEEECLKVLALYQPVAIDLRFIVTALKMNNDLERIGDLAVDIAEHSEFLAKQEVVDIPFNFENMAQKAHAMLAKSLDSLVQMDCELAREVLAADDEVDEMNRRMYRLVKEEATRQSDNIEVMIHMLSVARHLERIADHATNIAEDVIYMVEGEIVRHKSENYSVGEKPNSNTP